MNKDELRELDQAEQDALAHMLMKSIRGSWANPLEGRLEVLGALADLGLDEYKNSSVAVRVESYYDNEHFDGRKFRYIYENGPPLSEIVDKETARQLIGYIPPGDLTWDTLKLDKEYDG